MRFAQSQKGHKYRRHGYIICRAHGPLQVTKQVRNRADDAVTSRPPTVHIHPPKRCRPSYPLKSMQKATRRRAMITARITDHRISARAKHRSHRRSRVAHDIHIDKPIAPHNARPARVTICSQPSIYSQSVEALRQSKANAQTDVCLGRFTSGTHLFDRARGNGKIAARK